jgi:hypothetical protein
MDQASKKPILRVFVSATTADLGSVRRTVIEALNKLGCLPVEQTLFEPDYRSIEVLLRHKISECDAVLHFVGERYGAEPNPNSIPDNTPRRSYTQMEYDIAKKLKKKVFVFLCTDGFPYDECEPEDIEKQKLQKAYRDSLRQRNEKREYVSSSDECCNKVMHLQIQFEELTKSLRRQRAKTALLITIISILVALLLFVASEIWKQTVIQGKTSERQLSSLNERLITMSDSDNLQTIAEKSGVDPSVIKLAINRFKNQNNQLSVLEFADTLVEEGRIEIAVPFLRFIAEESLASNDTDYKFVTKTYLQAGKSLLKNIDPSKESEEQQLQQAISLLKQAIDSYSTLEANDQKEEVETLFDTIRSTKDATFSLIRYSTPIHEKSLLESLSKMFKMLDVRLLKDKGKQATFLVLGSEIDLRLLRFADHKQEKQLIELSDTKSSQAKNIAEETNSLEHLWLANKSLLKSWLWRIKTGNSTHRKEDYEKVISFVIPNPLDYEKPISLPITECRIIKNEAILDYCKYFSDREDEFMEEVGSEIDILTKFLRDQGEVQKGSYLNYLKSYLLELKIHEMGQRFRVPNYRETAESYIQRGYTDPIVYAEIYSEIVHRESLLVAKKNDLDPAIKYIEALLEKHTLSLTPRDNARLRSLLHTLYWDRSRCGELGDLLNAPMFRKRSLATLKDIEMDFPESHYPTIWAEAVIDIMEVDSESYAERFKTADEVRGFLSRITNIFTKEGFPFKWANAHLRCASLLKHIEPEKKDEFAALIEKALSVYTEEDYPDSYKRILKLLNE